MFVFNEWKEIKKAVENFLQHKVIINPLFVDNALIKINQGKLEDLIVTSRKWQAIGPFHQQFEKVE